AVAAVADPEVLRTVAAPVVVETKGEYTRGMTVVDLRRTWGAQDQTAEQPGDPSALCLTDDYACAGMDTYGEHVEPVRHRVGVDVDVDLFWALLVDALTRIGTTGSGASAAGARGPTPLPSSCFAEFEVGFGRISGIKLCKTHTERALDPHWGPRGPAPRGRAANITGKSVDSHESPTYPAYMNATTPRS